MTPSSMLSFGNTQRLATGRRLVYCKAPDRQPGDLAHQKDRQMLVAYGNVVGRMTPESIMEIGVCDGGSLAMWRMMWPDARVVGVDMTLEHVDEQTRAYFRAVMVETLQLKMPNPAVVECGYFDVVVDDGGHGSDSVLSSFATCWPMVNPGGVYIVEDWHLKEFDPARIVGELGKMVIGTDNGEHWCDGEFPLESALRVEVYRRLIAVFKR